LDGSAAFEHGLMTISLRSLTISSGSLLLVSQLAACLLFSDLDTEEALLAAADALDSDATNDSGDDIASDIDEDAFASCRAGDEQLVEGVPAREGDACGCEGTLVCGLDGSLTCIGESTPNACGGCGALPGIEGDPCGSCGGTWACQDDLMTCDETEITNTCGGCGQLTDNDDRPSTTGTPCTLPDESPGIVRCASLQTTACFPPTTNECGGEQPLDEQPGAPCGPCGGGRIVCNGPDQVRCVGESLLVNDCGGCGALDGANGDPCGCSGQKQCGENGQLTCQNDSTNACGGCSILTREPGADCGNGATVVCASADTVECQNELTSCLLNGEPVLAGESCGSCTRGIITCLPDGTGNCLGGSASNECGGCGALIATPGTTCAPFSQWTCTERGDVKCALLPCNNFILDPGESDIDCGGTACTTCGAGQTCSRDTDCTSLRCERGRCSAPDRDRDNVVDSLDNCISAFNPSQADLDRDGAGDACDTDRDGDAVPNQLDNCPDVLNLDQRDANRNGTGDACEST
jgi:hypothetical protein